MRSLTISLRLALIAAVFSLPIIVLVYLLTAEQSKGVEFAAAERRGVEYHLPARQLLQTLIAHRTLGARYVAGGVEQREALLSAQAAVDQDFGRLGDVDGRLGEALHTRALYGELKKSWEDLKGRELTFGAADLPTYLSVHDQINYDLIRLVNKMGNHSNLILDPDIDTYYLMDATQFKLPTLADELGRAQALGVAVLQLARAGQKAGEEAGPDLSALNQSSRTQLGGANTRATATLREGLVNLGYAFEANAALRAAVSGSADLMQSSVRDAIELGARKLVAPSSPQVDIDGWVAGTDRALKATFSLFDVALANLDQGLQRRMEGLRASANRALGAAAVALVFAIALVRVIALSITRPLASLSQAAEGVSLGDLRRNIDTDGSDEISDLARKFQRMQESLRVAADQAEL